MARALMNHIDPQAVALGVKAQNSEEVIRLLAGKLESLGYVRTTYADAVVRREATMPTGLPLGRAVNVAIPHTDPEHVNKPAIALAVLSEPVDFANMEDPEEAVPVGFVFLLAINDKDKQIDMLQEIMDTIQSEEALVRLGSARTIEDISAILA